MTDFLSSPMGKLDIEGRLLSPVCKGPTGKAGRFGFRGEIALKPAASTAGEKRPPDIKTDQVFMTCADDKIQFFASFVDSVAHLELIADLLAPYLTANGKYFVWAGNVDLLKKYSVSLNGATFGVLPLDEGTVYNEVLDLLYLEKGDLKKATMEQKLDRITDTAAAFRNSFPVTPLAQVVAEMGPVKVAENRPV
jgi:hypothetical protein